MSLTLALPPERVGPYVRALRAALDALAPNEEHVPLSAALDHLEALDPALGGDLLAPAEVATGTGMPAFTWLERARAEAVLARRAADDREPDEAELARVVGLDPALGARLRARRDLHRHLRGAELLPITRLGGAVRSVGAESRVALAYDRQAPDGRWVRIRLELHAPGRLSGPWSIDDGGRLRVDDAVQHLLTRHFSTSLAALRAQVQDALSAGVDRISRAWVGPFWFPGVRLPDGVPAALGAGLLLHTSAEVLALDVRRSVDLDPLEPPSADPVPDGHGAYRERRFAASAGVAEAVRSWAASRGCRPLVVPIAAGPRPRRL